MPTYDCVHKSLKQEIVQLEKRLQEQLNGRRALEEVLVLRRSSSSLMVHNSKPKAAVLMKEIAVLEMEVTLLEQYLLPLYRKALDSKVSFGSLSSIDKRQDIAARMPYRKSSPRPRVTARDGHGSIAKDVNGDPQEEMSLRSVPRCHSTLVEWSVQNSETAGSLAEAAPWLLLSALPTPEVLMRSSTGWLYSIGVR